MKQKRILVIRPDRIGDVVLATPLLRELRKTFPDAFIAVMVRPYTKDILINNPNIDEIIIDDYEGKDRGWRGFWRQVKKLRKYKFNIALHLLPTQRHVWMTFFAGIKTRINVGIRFYGVITLMKHVSRNKYIPLRHEADYTLDLGRKIGVKSDNLEPEIFLTDEEREKAKSFVPKDEGEIIIGINPVSGKSAPNWEVDKYVELTEKIIDQIPNAKIYVNASALKVPVVALFCPLPACSPKLWGPIGNESEIILPPENYCKTKCPGDPHICNFEGGIEVQDVLNALLKILRNKITANETHENSAGKIN
jgi:ADP-heptose:LPS heptosyltransferase